MAELVKRNNMFLVPFSKLVLMENLNDREDYGTAAEMDELAESIYQNGVRVPIMGYKQGDKYVVVQGHRRYRAGEMIKKRYKKEMIYKFLLYPPGTTEKEFLLDSLLTNSGKDFTPLEKAKTVSRLIERKATTKEIATALGGVSEVYVKNLQRLWGVPDNVKKLIRDNVVSATLIMSVLKNPKANLEEWIAEIEKQAKASGSSKKDGKGSKKKQAAVTAKKAPSSKKVKSIDEFTRFRKQNSDVFENKHKQTFFDFLCQLQDNKLSYTDILTFFTGK